MKQYAVKQNLAVAVLAGCTAVLGLDSPSGFAQEQQPATDGKMGWKAAAQAVAITPDKPMWMAGYASRNKPSEGKVHELFAKVLVLEDTDGRRVVIVTTDLIGIKAVLRGPVEARVEREFGIPPEALLMNASHTHCGPELREDISEVYGLDAEAAAAARLYTQGLIDKIVTAVGAAIAKLEPAELTYSHARAGFAMNRRLPTANGVINSPNPDGPVDHDVPVLRVQNAEGKLLAVLFGYACHNTSLSFYLFCGDYAGFAQEYLEAAHPGTVAMFMMGCGGDQNPYPRRTLELCQQHGRALANAVEAGLETLRTRPVHGPLRPVMKNVTLEFAAPPDKETLLEQAKSNNRYEAGHARGLLEQLEKLGRIPLEYEFPLQTIQFGDDLTLIAICGESCVEYSLRLKRELQQTPHDITDAEPVVWVAGYSNNVFGYLPNLSVLQTGGYEGASAMQYTKYPGPFAPSVEERVIGKVHELVKEARGR